MPYDHRMHNIVADKDGVNHLVPNPPVQATVNALFVENISSEEEMQAWYDKKRGPSPGKDPANIEEAALPRGGAELCEAIAWCCLSILCFHFV